MKVQSTVLFNHSYKTWTDNTTVNTFVLFFGAAGIGSFQNQEARKTKDA